MKHCSRAETEASLFRAGGNNDRRTETRINRRIISISNSLSLEVDIRRRGDELVPPLSARFPDAHQSHNRFRASQAIGQETSAYEFIQGLRGTTEAPTLASIKYRHLPKCVLSIQLFRDVSSRAFQDTDAFLSEMVAERPSKLPIDR
jgi:hypothetical protein